MWSGEILAIFYRQCLSGRMAPRKSRGFKHKKMVLVLHRCVEGPTGDGVFYYSRCLNLVLCVLIGLLRKTSTPKRVHLVNVFLHLSAHRIYIDFYVTQRQWLFSFFRHRLPFKWRQKLKSPPSYNNILKCTLCIPLTANMLMYGCTHRVERGAE